MSSTNEFVTVAFEEEQYCRTKKGLAQWDREKTLRVYGISTDDTVQIHFSLAENYGEAVSVEAAISNGAIEASIPPFIFEKKTSSSQRVYYAYAFIYLLNGESAETVRKIIFEIETRPKPEDYVYSPEEVKTWSKKVNLPLDEAGNPDNGTAGQFAVSDGQGGITWLTVENESETSGDAADVTYDDTKTGLGADNVQDAIGKLSEEIVDYNIEPKTDDIPKIFFDEAIPQTKDDVVTKFRYISKTLDFEGYAEFKAQGNSSMSYPKKNMTVKMYKDAELTEKLKIDFKCWGKQRKHVYKANWIDLLHARNIVSARIWADIVKSRSNYLELPELLRTSPNQGAVDGFPIKVYSQGIYQGRYTLNIPKDAWMANMDDELDNHCILCSENYVSGCFRALANIDGYDWTDEVHDIVPTSIKTRWNEVISFVMNNTDDEFKQNLSNYFDVTSLIDYHLFGLASCGLDAYGKNQLYFTYDGIKWIASMYDMDSTWGLYWSGASFVNYNYSRTEYEDFKAGDGNLLYIRLSKLFYNEIKERWMELKNHALSISNVINKFERFTDITPLELVQEDFATTTGNGLFTEIPSKTTNNIQQLREFALKRLQWTDKYIDSLVRIPCTGISLSENELTINGEESVELEVVVEPRDCTDEISWSFEPEAIVSINNGKITPLRNGTCTATVTCNGYTATCNITVVGFGEDATLMYSLPNEITVNGMPPVVTDVKPYSENGDRTILADFTSTELQNQSSHIVAFTCAPASSDKIAVSLMAFSLNGWCVRANGLEQYLYREYEDNKPSIKVKDNNRIRLAIITTESGLFKVKTSVDGVKANDYSQSKATFTTSDAYMSFGNFGDRNSSNGSWCGTIHDFKIYSRVLNDDEINEFLTS